MEGGYNLRNPAVKRLMRESQELREKTEQFSAYPLEDNLFEWHFTIRGPADSDFENGIYHGRIVLPPEYPMKPPSIILLTPSGRFETNRKICLSISGFHPESWQPSWSLRTALLGIIGFMPTHGNGAIGSLDYTSEERRSLARRSQDWKCPHCGQIKDLVLPITELSKELNKEAKEIGQQINMQVEKSKTVEEDESKNGSANQVSSNSNDQETASSSATTSATSVPSSAPTNSTSFSSTSSSLPQPPSYAQFTSSPLFASFQRPATPGSWPNFFPSPPFMYPLSSYPYGMSQNLFPPVSSSQLQQPLQPPFLPFIPPFFPLPAGSLPLNHMWSFPRVPPSSSSASTSGESSAINSSGFTQEQATNQSLFTQANTVTVSSQTTVTSSSTPVSSAGARPKEAALLHCSTLANTPKDNKPPIADQQSSASVQKVPEASSSETPTTSGLLNIQPSSSGESDKTKITPISTGTIQSDSSTSQSTSATSTILSDRDDGDPVPLASCLRQRHVNSSNTERATQPHISRTNISAEPPVTSRSRYTTRTGIMEAMVDMFVIFLLFCIFGLLARRVSMFL